MTPTPPPPPQPWSPSPTPIPSGRDRRWIIWSLAVVLFLFTLGILWWFGVGFGPPQSAQRAAETAQAAATKQQSYAYTVSGEIELEINRLPRPSGNTIIEGFASGPVIYTFPVELAGSRATSGQTEVSGSIDLSDASTALSGVLPSSATLEARYLDGVSYLKAPLFALLFDNVTTSSWIQTDLLADPDPSVPPTLFPATTILRGNRLGIEQLGPKLTAHYRYEVDRVNDALRLIGVHLPDGIGISEEGVIELWIDVWSHLPYQLKVTGELGFTDYAVTLDLTSQFHSFGEAITIESPASSQIIELTPAMLDLEAISSQVALRARDKQRKTDLIEIHQALKRYHNDHGVYPNTLGETHKTNEAGAVLEALVTEGYLAKLARDPQDSAYWYGYKSLDGANYELWSVLEFPKDEDGVARGEFFLYLLTPESVIEEPAEQGEETTPAPTEESSLPSEDTTTNDPADAPRLPVK